MEYVGKNLVIVKNWKWPCQVFPMYHLTEVKASLPHFKVKGAPNGKLTGHSDIKWNSIDNPELTIAIILL